MEIAATWARTAISDDAGLNELSVQQIEAAAN